MFLVRYSAVKVGYRFNNRYTGKLRSRKKKGKENPSFHSFLDFSFRSLVYLTGFFF